MVKNRLPVGKVKSKSGSLTDLKPNSFGETLAAVIWGQSDTFTRNQLKALAEQGWLEVMDEIEWGTLPVAAAALGQPRYRLPTACSVLSLQPKANHARNTNQ